MELLTPKEAGQYLKISVVTLAGWRSKGRGPKFMKTGRHVKYAKEDLDKYLKAGTVKTK
jgi:excisionase family DNA binding protein